MQIQQKIDYEAKQLLPWLHGIANILSNNPPITQTAELMEFSTLLVEIETNLGKIFGPTTTSDLPEIMVGSETSPRPATKEPPTLPVRLQNHCQHWTPLLPPSPERKQRHKDSHAPF